MAELKFPDPTVWVEYTLKSGIIDPPKLRLEIRPFTPKERAAYGLELSRDIAPEPTEAGKMFDHFLPVVMERVVGWDITVGGEAVPCEGEKKERALMALLWEPVIDEAEESPAGGVGHDPGDPDEELKKFKLPWLWARVLKVIGNRGSALKN